MNASRESFLRHWLGAKFITLFPGEEPQQTSRVIEVLVQELKAADDADKKYSDYVWHLECSKPLGAALDELQVYNRGGKMLKVISAQFAKMLQEIPWACRRYHIALTAASCRLWLYGGLEGATEQQQRSRQRFLEAAQALPPEGVNDERTIEIYNLAGELHEELGHVVHSAAGPLDLKLQ